jgi:CRISPR/Cas system-associated protein Csx1
MVVQVRQPEHEINLNFESLKKTVRRQEYFHYLLMSLMCLCVCSEVVGGGEGVDGIPAVSDIG